MESTGESPGDGENATGSETKKYNTTGPVFLRLLLWFHKSRNNNNLFV